MHKIELHDHVNCLHMQYSVHVALSSSHHREIFYSVCLNKLNKEISFIYLFGF